MKNSLKYFEIYTFPVSINSQVEVYIQHQNEPAPKIIVNNKKKSVECYF